MKSLVFGLLLATLPSAAFAETIIQCAAKDEGQIRIYLDAKEKFGSSLNCIEGSFPTEGEACAPGGGYGLARPTGLGELHSVVFRWQEFSDQIGPIYYSSITSDRIIFTGGFKGSGQSWNNQWNFTVDRITGDGTYFRDLSRVPEKRFTCRKVTPRF